MTGWQKSFVHAATGKRAATLKEVYRACSREERQLSAEFFVRYSSGHGAGLLTPFAGILQGPGPLAMAETLVRAAPHGDLYASLTHALGKALPGIDEVAVAVSGGIDSWLLAAILQSQGRRVCGWYLESGVPGYCEREEVERFSAELGIECRCIRVTAADFVQSLAELMEVAETPIYNLHPVSKLLLAKGLRREGVTAIVTGDGADQVMRWEWDCDLLPLTMTCFRSAGIRMIAPFTSEEVVRFCRQPYPDKQPVRDLARRLGLPTAAKHPTLFPPATLPSEPRAILPWGPAVCEHRARCLSYTTGLLLQALEDPTPCVESPA